MKADPPCPAFVVLALAGGSLALAAIVARPVQAQTTCKAFVGIVEIQRPCVFLPLVQNPPTPTPVPAPTVSAERARFLLECQGANVPPLKIEVPAGDFEGLVDVTPGSEGGPPVWLWYVWNEGGSVFRYVHSTEVVAHTGRSSQVIDGIGWGREGHRGSASIMLRLWSNAIGVVSAPDKGRVIEAYRLAFWVWVERTPDPSEHDALKVALEDCDGLSADNCDIAIRLGDEAYLDLDRFEANRWHYVETVWTAGFLRPIVTFADVQFDLSTAGTGTRVYLDDVELEVCGEERNRFGEP